MRCAGTRRSKTNPLRSIPFNRPAADTLQVPQAVTMIVEQIVRSWSAPSADKVLQREFAAAGATLAIAVDALASARLVVIDAKRRVTAATAVNGRLASGGRPIASERADRAEVGRVGRQQAQASAFSHNGSARACDLVGGKVRTRRKLARNIGSLSSVSPLFQAGYFLLTWSW